MFKKSVLLIYIYVISDTCTIDSTVQSIREKHRARIFKRSRSPGIDSKELIPPGWEPIPGLLKRFTSSDYVVFRLPILGAGCLCNVETLLDTIVV